MEFSAKSSGGALSYAALFKKGSATMLHQNFKCKASLGCFDFSLSAKQIVHSQTQETSTDSWH